MQSHMHCLLTSAISDIHHTAEMLRAWVSSVFFYVLFPICVADSRVTGVMMMICEKDSEKACVN